MHRRSWPLHIGASNIGSKESRIFSNPIKSAARRSMALTLQALEFTFKLYTITGLGPDYYKTLGQINKPTQKRTEKSMTLGSILQTRSIIHCLPVGVRVCQATCVASFISIFRLLALHLNVGAIPTGSQPHIWLFCIGARTRLHAWLPQVATQSPTTYHRSLTLSNLSAHRYSKLELCF